MFNMFEIREQRTDSVLCLHVRVYARLFDLRHLFAGWVLTVQKRLSAHPVLSMLCYVPLIFE